MARPDRDAWTSPAVEEVAPGVHRIPLPMPDDALKAVNVYALVSAGAVTLVDAGWGLVEARSRLERGLATLDHDLGSIDRFLVTHLHRDHYELSVEVRRLFGTRVALGRGERPGLESLIAAEGETPLLGRLRAAGAADLVRRARDLHILDRGAVAWEHPDEWLDDGQALDAAGRTLEVVATPGHTRGHVVFVDRVAGLLFAGDHVLPHITPSIGFEEQPPDTALVDYLASLERVRAMADLTLLPAHGPVRATTHDRVGELLDHHDRRLDESAAVATGDGVTALDVARALGWTRRATRFDDLDLLNQALAVNETLAHLDALVARDRLTMTLDDGVRTYRA